MIANKNIGKPVIAIAIKKKHFIFIQLCIQKTKKNKVIPTERETKYGQGLGLTKWKGCCWVLNLNGICDERCAIKVNEITISYQIILYLAFLIKLLLFP